MPKLSSIVVCLNWFIFEYVYLVIVNKLIGNYDGEILKLWGTLESRWPLDNSLSWYMQNVIVILILFPFMSPPLTSFGNLMSFTLVLWHFMFLFLYDPKKLHVTSSSQTMVCIVKGLLLSKVGDGSWYLYISNSVNIRSTYKMMLWHPIDLFI